MMHSEKPLLSYLLSRVICLKNVMIYTLSVGLKIVAMGESYLFVALSLALASVTGAQNPCDVFKTMSCPISEVNILGEHTTADTAECQTW